MSFKGNLETCEYFLPSISVPSPPWILSMNSINSDWSDKETSLLAKRGNLSICKYLFILNISVMLPVGLLLIKYNAV